MYLFISAAIFWSSCLGVGADDYTLTVLHTNDVHARFDQFTAQGSVCKTPDELAGRCFGGVARRARAVEDVRRDPEEPNVLLLDAGDQFQGTLWFQVHKGSAAAHFMNLLQYDAMALGNHEFDLYVPGLVPFLQNVTFPILSANIDATHEPDIASHLRKSVVLRIGGEDIGIIGYTTKETSVLSRPGKLRFLDEVEAIRAEVNSLTASGVNKVIAVGHAGIHVDKQIASSIPGVDLVVGGHTNTFLYSGDAPADEEPIGPYPLVVDQLPGRKALVVQDYAFGKYLGHLQVTFDEDGHVTRWQGNPILLDNSFAEDPGVLAEVSKWRKPMEDASNEILGYSHVLLEGSNEICRLRECNMGNLVTDAMVHQHLDHPDDRYWANVSIALIGGGGIRASIPPGSVTSRDVLEVQPFRNTVDLVELEGRHLLQVLEHSVQDYSPEIKHGKFLQMSGLRVKYDLSKPNKERVVSVDVRCCACAVPRFESLEPNTRYRLIMDSFLIRGGDGYDMISRHMHAHHIFGDVDTDILTAYITKVSPIITGIEDRIQFVDYKQQCATSRSTGAVLLNNMICVVCLMIISHSFSIPVIHVL